MHDDPCQKAKGAVHAPRRCAETSRWISSSQKAKRWSTQILHLLSDTVASQSALIPNLERGMNTAFPATQTVHDSMLLADDSGRQSRLYDSTTRRRRVMVSSAPALRSVILTTTITSEHPGTPSRRQVTGSLRRPRKLLSVLLGRTWSPAFPVSADAVIPRIGVIRSKLLSYGLSGE